MSTLARSQRARWLLSALAAVALAGCVASDETELRGWMDETRKTMRPTNQPVPEPKQFTPQPYGGKAMLDPFDAQRMMQAVARQAPREAAGALKPDLDRRREVLEGFALDQLRMVGTLRRSGANVALIDVAGQTYMVRVGNYIGQNFGLVTGITETEVTLKEIVQDAAGEWVERTAKLELQEGSGAQGRKR